MIFQIEYMTLSNKEVVRVSANRGSNYLIVYNFIRHFISTEEAIQDAKNKIRGYFKLEP